MCIRDRIELGTADSATALACEVHSLASAVVGELGTAAQRETWLPRYATGVSLGGMALTESGAGSDLGAVATTAVWDGTEWVVDGAKNWITNTATRRADGFVLLTRAGDGDRAYHLFLLPGDAAGFERGERIETLGWRSMDTRPVRLLSLIHI